MEPTVAQNIELGTMLGRGQAFGVLANQGMAAQAECLRKIYESGLYKNTGLTWERFCPELVGLSRQTVENLIHNLKEYGVTFLHLSEIVKISPETPETYRQMASSIHGDQIEIDGELVDIAPENAARIRQAVLRLRTQLQKAKERQLDSLDRRSGNMIYINALRPHFEDYLADMARFAQCVLAPEETRVLRQLITDISDALKRISKDVEETARVVAERDFPSRRPSSTP